MDSTYTKLIEDAWAFRVNQDRQNCDLALGKIRILVEGLRYPSSQLPVRKLLLQSDYKNNLNSLSLILSLLRWEDRSTEYQKLNAEIEACLRELDLSPSFWLLFEKAFSCLRKGDYLESSESFHIARGSAETEYRKLSCDINILAVKLALNLPRQDLVKGIKKQLALLKNDFPLETISEQYQVHAASTCFHEGEFSQLTKVGLEDEKFNNQVSYLKAFVTSLPYASNYGEAAIYQEDFYSNNKSVFNSKYRVRSLMGTLHPDDAVPTHFSSWADRFYLWVWRWLVDPETTSLERLMSILTPLFQQNAMYRFTSEDKQLVRNALLWLSLFDSSSKYKIDSLLSLVSQDLREEYSLLAYEKLIIYYFIALRDKEEVTAVDYFTSIQEHPFYVKKGLGLNSLLLEKLPKNYLQLSKLFENLQMIKARGTNAAFPVLIDLLSFQIENTVKGKKVVSDSMTKALEILKDKDSISIEELVAYTYGITKYDSVIHQGKLFNLLSRTKDMTEPYLTIKVKSNRVYIKGNWKAICFMGNKSESRNLMGNLKWRELVYQKNNVTNDSQAAIPQSYESLDKSLLTREELEAVMKRSRATVGRLLSHWEKEGFVKKFGKARATKYELSRYLINEIKSGRAV